MIIVIVCWCGVVESSRVVYPPIRLLAMNKWSISPHTAHSEQFEKCVVVFVGLFRDTYDNDYSISYLIIFVNFIFFVKQLWSQTRKVKPFNGFSFVWL